MTESYVARTTRARYLLGATVSLVLLAVGLAGFIDFEGAFSAVRWWLTLFVLGLLAIPLCHLLFGRLADKGYAFSKMLALLITGYAFWLLGSLGFLGNNLGGVIVTVLLLIGLSYWAHRRQVLSLSQWFRANWQQIYITELLFMALFFAWVWVRSQNPSIAATEKPMEFAFLNAIGRSAQFPPHDPWLSGFSISYYYFGYVMTALVAKLAAVDEPIAFNLAVAWLVAGTGTGAFGLLYNMLAHKAVNYGRKLAVGFALIAAIAIPLAGNLEILLEVAHANGVGSAEFWAWLDIQDINEPPRDPDAVGPARYETGSWWWWRSSRVINEYSLAGVNQQGLSPIAEFPAFSFVLGDVHPHVLALPFAFLSLALALSWWLRPGRPAINPAERTDAAGPISDMIGYLRARIDHIGPAEFLLGTLIIGGLSFLNTWDVFIHLFILIVAYGLALWRESDRERQPQLFSQAALMFFLVLIPAFLLYLPFYLGFRSQAGAPYILPMLMQPTRLVQFLVIFGMPLLPITALLLTLSRRLRGRQWQFGLLSGVGLIVALLLLMAMFGLIVASAPEGSGRVVGLASELGIALAPYPGGSLGASVGWGLSAIGALAGPVLAARFTSPWVTLLLGSLLVVTVGWLSYRYRPDPGKPSTNTAHEPMLPFALILILTGLLLTLGPEYLYLRDNFGVRLNTIFKFYYQAWVFLGIGALFSLHYLVRHLRPVGYAVTTVYMALFVGVLLFPYYAVQSRAVEYRGPVTAETRREPTLDGTTYISHFNADEHAAINWFRDNIEGQPVVLEAIGGQYSSFGRISANTGLPTVLGWAGHQYQWRGSTPEPAAREAAVTQIYNETGWSDPVIGALNRYDVEYIYVGSLERQTYDPDGLLKFDETLPVIYQNNTVTIYQWQPLGN